jgi:hypothetical protein
VRVHCDEGIANHIGPEPCAGVREDTGEASAGERIGQPLSREIDVILGADAVLLAEGNMDGCVIASARPAQRGRRPWHVQTLLAREPGDLMSGQGGVPRWPAPGRRGAVAGDARA